MSKKSGIHELYAGDPLQADRELWGRESDGITRRGFLRGSGLVAMSAALGASIPFAKFMPAGLIPAALAETRQDFQIAGKNGLIVLNDRPLNMETPAHLLDDRITPAARMFVRNNGIPPTLESINIDDWRLEVAGEAVTHGKTFSIADLKSRFRNRTLQLQIECGGNGRSEFYPPATGNQWTTGAIACPQWTGVRLRDVLQDCGIADNAVYVAYESADKHLSGDASLQPISRGVPMAKALEDESMIAWAMNGEPLPLLHGYPLRLVCAGWPASVSGKWLTRLLVRDRVHDGEKMTGQSYKMPCEPVAPGTEIPDDKMCIIESMPVRSLVTFPKSGIDHAAGKKLVLRGHAWAGDREVRAMRTSIDFGATWQKAKLEKAVNRLAWQHWATEIAFPQAGYYEIWAQAEDAMGIAQPMVLPGWNPRGYLNNACHRIAVMARA